MTELSDLDNSLHCAANDGNPALVAELLKAGADPNARNRGGNYALNLATRRPVVEVVRLLVQAGAALEQVDSAGFTPLLGAAFNGHREVVDFLLEAGADPRHRCHQGRTAAGWAMHNQHAHLAERLHRAEMDRATTDARPGGNAKEDAPTTPDHPDEDAIQAHYRRMARSLVSSHGSLLRVEFLTHYPDFEIDFVFARERVRSGRRRGQHDIHFLSLGYTGEGPRCARAFLQELGVPITAEEIAGLKPGATITSLAGRVMISYPGAAGPAAEAGNADACAPSSGPSASLEREVATLRARQQQRLGQALNVDSALDAIRRSGEDDTMRRLLADDLLPRRHRPADPGPATSEMGPAGSGPAARRKWWQFWRN